MNFHGKIGSGCNKVYKISCLINILEVIGVDGDNIILTDNMLGSDVNLLSDAMKLSYDYKTFLTLREIMKGGCVKSVERSITEQVGRLVNRIIIKEVNKGIAK
jgi:hypothetical protein